MIDSEVVFESIAVFKDGSRINMSMGYTHKLKRIPPLVKC